MKRPASVLTNAMSPQPTGKKEILAVIRGKSLCWNFLSGDPAKHWHSRRLCASGRAAKGSVTDLEESEKYGRKGGILDLQS